MRRISIIFFFTTIITSSISAQILIGPKVGGLYYKHNFHDQTLLRDNAIEPAYDFGYNAGAVLIYSLSEKFAMQTEILYAVKGKKLTGGIQDQFSHEAIYKYVEVPLLFKYMIKRKTYTGYIHGGGNFSYWLSGKGKLKSSELEGLGLESIDYEILFNPSVIDDESNNLNLSEPNRVQVGLDIGVGALFNTFHNKNKILIDLRYQYGHSWLARDNDILVGINEYREDLRSSYVTFSLSAGYLFGLDFGQGKKGKSVSKRPRKIVTKKARKVVTKKPKRRKQKNK